MRMNRFAALAVADMLFGSDALLGLLTHAVQALAGVLLPSSTVFLLLLCNAAVVLVAFKVGLAGDAGTEHSARRGSDCSAPYPVIRQRSSES